MKITLADVEFLFGFLQVPLPEKITIEQIKEIVVLSERVDEKMQYMRGIAQKLKEQNPTANQKKIIELMTPVYEEKFELQEMNLDITPEYLIRHNLPPMSIIGLKKMKVIK